MDMNMKSDQDNNYNENSGTHDNHSTMVLNKALPSTSNENGLQITEQSSSATCVTSTNCCLTNYNNSVNDDVPINQVTTSSELQSNEITCYSDAVNQINCHSITTAISNHNDVESNGEMSILHNNYQNGSENLSDKTSDNGENIEATVAAGTSSIQNMLKKKQFMQEITISNSVSLSDNNSQSFISTTKEPIRKNIIRKKEFLKNNRRPDSEDLSGNKLNDYQNCTNYHSLDLQNEKLTRGIHVLDNEPCSSTGQINLSTSICDEASSLPLELPNLDSTDSDSIIVTQKPFKLPSLVNLFEAAEAQRIELEENASGSIDPLSLTHHREMDGAQALNPDSSEGSNSDTESQRANDVHRSEVAKKRVRSMNGTMSQDRVEYYHLWRSTGGQSSMPETLYDNLYTDPPPLPPRTAHRPLHRRNALPASLTCKRHYKHSTPCRPENKGIASSILRSGKLSYKSSGVDIEAGDSLVSIIKPLVASTTRTGVLGSIGSFGGLFDTKAAGYKDPILVSGTDGVGTKLKTAISCGKHNSVGIDLVAMCVNDVLAHGAEPLFFLDYFVCGRLDINTAAEVISGVVEGCKRAGCSLIGGETAEMPDMYTDGEYDLAGFAVGAVERFDLLPRTNEIANGDLVIGLPSSGVHRNGFSLVRKILKLAEKSFNDIAPFSVNGKTIGAELLEPTKIYTKGVIPALKSKLVKGFAHITGGGLTENIPRVLPHGFGVTLDVESWKILPVFSWLATVGGINESEMLRTFNCEIGAILICSSDHKTQVLDLLKDECPILIGHVNIHNEIHPRVQVQNFSKALAYEMRKYVPTLVESLAKPLKKVGVLISGNGTNLQALIVEIDSGAIIEQEAVPVFPNDTIETLQERVKTAEHRAYPKALQYLATERIKLRDDGTLQWND